MLKIKLSRFGKKHQPHYRIVIAEAGWKRDGKYLECIGNYYPLQKKGKKVTLDQKKYQAWIKKGAKPTKTVRRLSEK